MKMAYFENRDVSYNPLTAESLVQMPIIIWNVCKDSRAMKRYIISNWSYLLALCALSLTTFVWFAVYVEKIDLHQLTFRRVCSEENNHLSVSTMIKQYSPFCGPYTLRNHRPFLQNQELSAQNQSGACKISPVEKWICEDIKDRYYTYSSDYDCPAKVVFELCKLKNAADFDRENLASMVFSCDLCACEAKYPFSVGFLDSRTGLLTWNHIRDFDNVERNVTLEAIKTLKAGNPFLFLRCTSKTTLDYIPHLLVLPFVPFGPNRHKASKCEKCNEKSFVNINMILIDSVSRPHFYRSLPRTTEYLAHLHNTHKHSVLDFELFHAVKARTFESLHALFTGELLQVASEFEGVAIPPQAVGFQKLLKQFKDQNYEIMYQEDLCWEHDWGLIRDTGVFKEKIDLEKRYSVLNAAFKHNFIEHIGMTHSSCEVFHSYDIIDHFNYPPKVCYGGRLQHDFFLEYLLDAIKSRAGKPLFSFAVMNVGHEGTGRRIRTFDESLKDFLTQFEDQQDTVHILFSDHGNNYGPFSATSEGRFEMFNSFLFMLIPNLVAERIGAVKMRNLETNQKRLINLVDLHHTLLSLLGLLRNTDANTQSSKDDRDTDRLNRKDKKSRTNYGRTRRTNLGLLGEISLKRGCDDVHFLRGTLCFCEGWKSTLRAASVHYLIAEFALAMLNKVIIKSQIKKGIKTSSKNFCEYLQGYNIKNIWQRRKRGKLTFGMDITTQKSSVFSVVVLADIDRPNSLNLQLDSVERLTRYGQYKTCAHPGVNLKYCVCSLKGSNEDDRRFPGSAIGSMFQVKTISRQVHYPCFYILSRTHKAGVVFEASNSCWNVSYTVDLRFTLTNMKLAQETHKTKVPPGSVRYLATVIMAEAGFEWKWQYNIDLTWAKVQKHLKRKQMALKKRRLKTTSPES